MACTVLGRCRNSGKCGSIQPLSADPRLGISDSIESKNRAFPALLCQDINKSPGFQKGQNGKIAFWPQIALPSGRVPFTTRSVSEEHGTPRLRFGLGLTVRFKKDQNQLAIMLDFRSIDRA